ncbi:hypothetical protein PHLH8_58650 [Pseudomonas sp. Pc102]|nr:hypothetical protein PHLH8_58650 [Pseudomonas sp. Pc102]
MQQHRALLGHLGTGAQLQLVVALEDAFAAVGQLQLDGEAVGQGRLAAVVEYREDRRQRLEVVEARQHQGLAGGLAFETQGGEAAAVVDLHRQADFGQAGVAHINKDRLGGGLLQWIDNAFGADPDQVRVGGTVADAVAQPGQGGRPAEFEVDLGNQAGRLQGVAEHQAIGVHGDGAGGFLDALADEADVGEAALVAGGIDGDRLDHDQGVACHFFGAQGSVQALAQAVALLAVDLGEDPARFGHAQEGLALGLADHAAGGAQVGGAQAGEGQAEVAEVDVVLGVEAGHQVLLAILALDRQLGEFQLRGHGFLLEGFAVVLDPAVGVDQFDRRLQDVAAFETEAEGAGDAGVGVTRGIGRQETLAAGGNADFGQVTAIIEGKDVVGGVAGGTEGGGGADVYFGCKGFRGR